MKKSKGDKQKVGGKPPRPEASENSRKVAANAGNAAAGNSKLPIAPPGANVLNMLLKIGQPGGAAIVAQPIVPQESADRPWISLAELNDDSTIQAGSAFAGDNAEKTDSQDAGNGSGAMSMRQQGLVVDTRVAVVVPVGPGGSQFPKRTFPLFDKAGGRPMPPPFLAASKPLSSPIPVRSSPEVSRSRSGSGIGWLGPGPAHLPGPQWGSNGGSSADGADSDGENGGGIGNENDGVFALHSSTYRRPGHGQTHSLSQQGAGVGMSHRFLRMPSGAGPHGGRENEGVDSLTLDGQSTQPCMAGTQLDSDAFLTQQPTGQAGRSSGPPEAPSKPLPRAGNRVAAFAAGVGAGAVQGSDSVYPPVPGQRTTLHRFMAVVRKPIVNPYLPAVTRSSRVKTGGFKPKLDGTHVSRYVSDFEELGQLGGGSFSDVFRVRSRMDGCVYAVKKCKSAMQASFTAEALKEKEVREVLALAALAPCPHVLRYYSSWVEDRHDGAYLYIQTELAWGTLKDALEGKRRGIPGPAQAAASVGLLGLGAAVTRAPSAPPPCPDPEDILPRAPSTALTVDSDAVGEREGAGSVRGVAAPPPLKNKGGRHAGAGVPGRISRASSGGSGASVGTNGTGEGGGSARPFSGAARVLFGGDMEGTPELVEGEGGGQREVHAAPTAMRATLGGEAKEVCEAASAGAVPSSGTLRARNQPTLRSAFTRVEGVREKEDDALPLAVPVPIAVNESMATMEQPHWGGTQGFHMHLAPYVAQGGSKQVNSSSLALYAGSLPSLGHGGGGASQLASQTSFIYMTQQQAPCGPALGTYGSEGEPPRAICGDAELLVLLAHIGRALMYLHDVGIVHLDVKPENVLVTYGVGPGLCDQAGQWSTAAGCATGLCEQDATVVAVGRGAASLCPGEGPGQGWADASCIMGTQAAGEIEAACAGRMSEAGKAVARAAAAAVAAGASVESLHGIRWKLGDLGSAVSAAADDPADGDARYLAMEKVTHSESCELAPVDVFALGLTAFEAASGVPLPMDGAPHAALREEALPREAVPHLCPALYELLCSMTHVDPSARPTAKQLVSHPLLRSIPDVVTVDGVGRIAESIRQGQAVGATPAPALALLPSSSAMAPPMSMPMPMSPVLNESSTDAHVYGHAYGKGGGGSAMSQGTGQGMPGTLERTTSHMAPSPVESEIVALKAAMAAAEERHRKDMATVAGLAVAALAAKGSMEDRTPGSVADAMRESRVSDPTGLVGSSVDMGGASDPTSLASSGAGARHGGQVTGVDTSVIDLVMDTPATGAGIGYAGKRGWALSGPQGALNVRDLGHASNSAWGNETAGGGRSVRRKLSPRLAQEVSPEGMEGEKQQRLVPLDMAGYVEQIKRLAFANATAYM